MPFFFLPILFFLLNGVRGKIPNGKKWKLKTWNNFLPFFYSSFIQNSFIQKNRFFNFVKYTCHATIFILYTTKGHEIYRPSCGCVRSSAFRWVPWVDTSAWVFHHVLAIKVVAFFWLFSFLQILFFSGCISFSKAFCIIWSHPKNLIGVHTLSLQPLTFKRSSRSKGHIARKVRFG